MTECTTTTRTKTTSGAPAAERTHPSPSRPRPVTKTNLYERAFVKRACMGIGRGIVQTCIRHHPPRRGVSHHRLRRPPQSQRTRSRCRSSFCEVGLA